MLGLSHLFGTITRALELRCKRIKIKRNLIAYLRIIHHFEYQNVFHWISYYIIYCPVSIVVIS